MLSSLSKGYGSWTAGQVDPYYGEKYRADHILPDIDQGTHRHGITVTSRSGRSTAMSWAGPRPVSRQHTEPNISLPKTYTTRKGALQLFVGPDYEEEDDKVDDRLSLKAAYSQLRRQFTKQELVDLSLKLGTLERLTKSVLQFGDEEYDHEKTSVTDEKNKAFLKFLHSVSKASADVDSHVQPGGDLTSYLRDLKSSASNRYYSDGSTYIPKSRESQELQAILRGLDSNWPLSFKQDSFSDVQSSGPFTRPVSRGPSPGPPSTPRSTYQVLSSRKVAASIKSGSYLGRPSSTVSDFDIDESLADFDFLPVTKAIVSQRTSSTPDFLNPEDLITGRRGLGFRSVTNSSIGEETEEDDITDSYFDFGKRKRTSKKPDLAYQGRNARKGESQHSDVKVKGKGDGLDGESQFMDSIVEEVGETAEKEVEDLGVVVDDDTESVDWEAQVAKVEKQREKLLTERTSVEPNLIKKVDSYEPTADEVTAQQKVNEIADSIVREGSAHSTRSRRSSVSSTSTSSKHSKKGGRTMSIVTVQEYNAPRPSSTPESRTYTPLSRHSPKRSASTSSDKQSKSNFVKPDSRRASITGSELRHTESSLPCTGEIAEVQEIAVCDDENQQLQDLNERETEFVTQNQIHIDISYGIDEDYLTAIEKVISEEISDLPDNAGLVKMDETQIDIDKSVYSSDDQKSNDSELEDENNWAGKENIEEQHEDAEKDELTVNGLKPDSPDDLSKLVSNNENAEADTETEIEERSLDNTQTEVILTHADIEKTAGDTSDIININIVEKPEKVVEEVDVVKQENLAGKAEEDSVLDESASTKGKSVKSAEGEEINYGAGLQAIGPLLSDVHSDKGDKSGATGKLSRPASGKLSRPSSGKLSRPSSGKISRPQSRAASRQGSGRATPEVKPSSAMGQEIEVSEPHITGSKDAVHTSQGEIRTEMNQSEEVQENITDNDNKTGSKQESITESKGAKPQGRQRALKVKKPAQQRQRPGKRASQVNDRPPVAGGYIPQEDSTKDIDKKSDNKVSESDGAPDITSSIPDITVEPDTSKVDGELEKRGSQDGSETDDSHDNAVYLGADTDTDATSIISELDALGLRVPAKQKKKHVKEKEKLVIPSHLEEVLNRQPTRSYEALEADLEKMTELVDESLSEPTLAAVGEGLTEEELELAKQILQKKLKAAREKLDQPEKKPAPKKKAVVKSAKKPKGRKTPVDTRTEEEIERDEIKEKQRLEKLKRDQEAKELQRKIAERKLLLKAQTDAQSARSKELEAEMRRFQREADEIQQAEDQARDAMAELRKKQREEREIRRKADLERRKQDAIARREREKRQMEETKKKELEMLEKIADAEMRRRLREEEERKMYEEERLAQEKLEEELREAQRQAEEDEERMKELERQAEEEAMQRLIEEREAAERQRRRLQEEKEAMEEAERLKLEYLRQEELRLQEEKQRMEEEEMARREREKERLAELRRLEEEARAKMQEELEKRRADALARRDFNIENRQNKDKLGHGQGITRAWTFSYFIKWPRESYEKSMGGIDPRKKRLNPRPKKQPPPASAGAERPQENPAPS